ncbi:MAG TPA: ribosome-binding factor A [Candidatus Paceibacterota bacterium]|jgi:ribosome-binding factor A
MSRRRHVRIQDELKKHAATFLERESNRASLITVTSAELSPDFREATIFVSVFPTEREVQALDFIKRQERDFRLYLSEHARLQRAPSIRFELDLGEKNRRRIDELLQE